MAEHMRGWLTRSSMLALAGMLVVAGGLRADPTTDAPQPQDAPNVAELVKDLDADTFEARQRATDRLIALGRSAADPASVVDPLVAAAEQGSLEMSMRVVTVLKDLLAAPGEGTSATARQGLQKLTESKNEAVKSRASVALEPPTNAAAPQPAAAAGGIVIPGGVGRPRIILPPNGIGGNIQIQGNGAIAVFQVQAMNGNGQRNVRVQENGRTIAISENPQAVTVTVTEVVGGKPKTTSWTAKNADELKKNHPEAHKLYIKHMGPQPFFGQAPPAIVMQAGANGLLPDVRAKAGKRLEEVGKQLEASLKMLRDRLADEQAANDEELQKLVEELEKAQRELESVRKQLN